MVATLDGCIQEMRLAVDALSVTDGDLGLLLANLRHRLQPGLLAAGLALDWQVVDTPPVPALTGAGGRDLLRIVQEALSNVLQHAQARRVTVRTALDAEGGGVSLVIGDDGRGMPTDATLGRGIHNIRQRAARLGARVDWVSPAVAGAAAGPGIGTQLRLWLPLAPAAA